MKKITINLIVAVFAIISFGHRAIAQEKSQSQTTIKIIKSENGKITKSEKVIEGEPNGSIQELFEENGILDEINFTNEDSEDFEIIIRKLKNDLDHETDRFHKMVFISKDDENQDTKAFLGIYGMPSENIKIINDNGNIEVINEEPEDSKVDETIGVEITGIVSDSPAEKAGLLKGDKITQLNEINVNKFGELADFIAGKKPGDELIVSFVRGGNEMSQNIILGEKKPRYSGIYNMANSFVFDYENESKPFLGVTLDEEVDEGIKVTEIVEKSTAQAIGLKSGDIITKINSNKINSFENLKTELSKLEVGE
jgi:S1-C subfamily serine protease